MSGTRAISTISRSELSSGFFFLQDKAPKETHAILTETLSWLLPGGAKDLSAPLYCVYRKTGSYCQIVMKFEFYQQIFEKYSNMQFNKNPSSGSRVLTCGQMERHDEASSHFFAILRTRLKRHLYVKITAKKSAHTKNA